MSTHFLVVNHLARRAQNLELHSFYRRHIGAKEGLEAVQVRPGGQRGALHEHTLPGGGPVGPQGPQLRAALLLQVAGGEAGVGRHGCLQHGLEESEDSLQGGADYTQGSGHRALHGSQCGATPMTMKLRQLLVAFALM